MHRVKTIVDGCYEAQLLPDVVKALLQNGDVGAELKVQTVQANMGKTVKGGGRGETGRLLPGERFHIKTHIPIRHITDEPKPPKRWENGGGKSEVEGVCLHMCCKSPAHLISFPGLDKISSSDTLPHTHSSQSQPPGIFTSLMWGNL